MPVIDVNRDLERCTLQITSRFDAPVEAVWQLWADPRRLERWWGPPTYPATFVEHVLTPGGSASYYMTGPEGDRAAGWWRIIDVDAPHRLVIEDGFSHDDGTPNDDLPITVMRVVVEARAEGGSTMQIESTFSSTPAMEQMLAMGMEEGTTLAIGQIDELLLESV